MSLAIQRTAAAAVCHVVCVGGGLLSIAALGGCHHREEVYAPAPPPLPPYSRPAPQRPPDTAQAGRTRPAMPPAPAPSVAAAPPVTAPVAGDAVSLEDQEFVASHQPIYSEEGVASWYGPPYHNRQGANGKVYNQNAMTAAHRTLPLGSLIVVTNETTGQAATVRVTDRGPFVEGRQLDLSMASAKAIGVYRAGLANVRIDVYMAPKAIGQGGRWCVQIGAFEHRRKAEKLRDELEDRYTTAQVIDFEGPTGYWVRIRPQGDNKQQAELIVRRVKPVEGNAFLVRLD